MTDHRIAVFQQEANKAVQFLQGEFAKLQTGRANAAAIEHVNVEAYGQKQPLRNVAGISVQDARTIVVQSWDPSILQNVEKALQQADVGASPVNDGHLIRLNLPPLTQERREQLRKLVQTLAEDARISVRKLRQHAQDTIKEEKDEDIRETLLEELQREVDKLNQQIDDLRKQKEEDIMKV